MMAKVILISCLFIVLTVYTVLSVESPGSR